MLYLIPTPIGNLEDITVRAIRILKEVRIVLAEDTRTSKRLLDHYGIATPLRAFHAHNEHAKVSQIADELSSGSPMALISDAGTPGISDPGFLLVRACVQRGIRVECLPGATAFVPALVASGLPSDTFHFDGFLPHKKGRQTRLKYLAELPHTFILYESPFRLLKCLEELTTVCGSERMACVARELTKKFEEVKTATLADLLAHLKGRARLMLEIKKESSQSDSDVFERRIVAEIVKSGVRVSSDMETEIAVISFATPVLERMAVLLPDAPRGHLFYRDPEEVMFAAAARAGAAFVMPEKGHVSPGLIERARSRALGMATWVCDDPSEFAQLCTLGLLGIGTNRPAEMIGIG